MPLKCSIQNSFLWPNIWTDLCIWKSRKTNEIFSCECNKKKAKKKLVIWIFLSLRGLNTVREQKKRLSWDEGTPLRLWMFIYLTDFIMQCCAAVVWNTRVSKLKKKLKYNDQKHKKRMDDRPFFTIFYNFTFWNLHDYLRWTVTLLFFLLALLLIKIQTKPKQIHNQLQPAKQWTSWGSLEFIRMYSINGKNSSTKNTFLNHNAIEHRP